MIRPRNVQQRRAAFTLLETLLAIALGIGLLSGIITSLQQAYRTENVCLDRIQNAKTVLGLLSDLRGDLQRVRFAKGHQHEETETSETSGEYSSLLVTFGSLMSFKESGAEAAIDVPVAFHGTTTQLTMALEVANPRFVSKTATVEDPALAGARIAVWFLRKKPSSPVVIRFESGREEAVSIDDGNFQSGLCRFSQLENHGTTPSTRLATTVAHRSSNLRFRYFDGERWVPDWDSSQKGTLPRAVEISLRLKSENEPVRYVIPCARSGRHRGEA